MIEISKTFSDAILADEIQDARKHLNQSPTSIGKCLYCERPLDKGLRFCDMDCALDAERLGTYDGGYIPVDKNRRINRGQRPQYLTK